jgi:hypothetical protein
MKALIAIVLCMAIRATLFAGDGYKLPTMEDRYPIPNRVLA